MGVASSTKSEKKEKGRRCQTNQIDGWSVQLLTRRRLEREDRKDLWEKKARATQQKIIC